MNATRIDSIVSLTLVSFRSIRSFPAGLDSRSAGPDGSDLDGSDLRLVQADVERSAGDPAAVAGVVDAMGDFTLDLWAQLPADQNLALSPYSISVALAMTANGARGATARAMDDVLHVSSLASYNAGLAALTQELAGLAGPVEVNGKKGEIDLAPANQLFGDASIHFQQAFLTVLAKMYGAGMSEPNSHSPENLPILLAGGGAAGFTPGRHVRFANGTPLANLNLTILNRFGIAIERLGDSSKNALATTTL